MKKSRQKVSFLLLLGMMVCGLFMGCGAEGAENAPKESENRIDNGKSVYHAIMPDKAQKADIYVEPIKGLPENFIKGMDISTVLSEEESGVVYYDTEGKEEDLFRILADAGLNYIRVRVWNDPYDSDGNGYGGGNVDAKRAAVIGRRAAENGMKLLVDFHYSDFWADPAKQKAPKEWAHFSLNDKKTAIYDYTIQSLKEIADAGSDIGMVQIGNEINNGMAGETDPERILTLLTEASRAIRDFSAETGQEVKIAVHYTQVDDVKAIKRKAKELADANLDYDVFGISYYPFWHGTMENMKNVLKDISETYDVDTCIMETSYAYTLEDGDQYGNSVSEGNLQEGYAATVQSQATCIRDICAYANEAGALGVFYWEGAWIPVGNTEDGTPKEEAFRQRQELWETFGSGWATSYAKKYDPKDAGENFGGCAWDNQAMFDFEGHPLASLDVFKYLNYGTVCEKKVDYLLDCVLQVNVGETLQMPNRVAAVYNTREENDGILVTWDETQVAQIDSSVMGEYIIDGKLESGETVTCEVSVKDVNYVLNESFEEQNVSMWTVYYEGDHNPTDVQRKAADAFTGDNAFHFWDDVPVSFTLEQEIKTLQAGNYALTARLQGGDVGSDALIYIYVEVNGTRYESDPVELTGWINWKEAVVSEISVPEGAEVKVGAFVSCAAKGWGTIDDFYLHKE